MNILITGATGFIGSRFIEMADAWLGKEDKLVLLSSKKIPDHICILHQNYAYDVDAFYKAGIDRIDKIIHVGHFIPERHSNIPPAKGNLSSIKNTEYLIEHLPNIPETFVYCSSMDVYGRDRKEEIDEESSLRADTPYAVSKIMTEMLLQEWARKYHVRLHILRLAHIYGPRDARIYSIPIWLRAVQKKEPIRLFANSDMYRNCVYIDDCCKALWAAANLEEDIEVINVVSKENYTMKELAGICREVSGNGYEIETVPCEPCMGRQYGIYFKNNSRCSRYLTELECDIWEGLKREFAYYEKITDTGSER